MDFDEYEYLEKAVEDPEIRTSSGKKDGDEKSRSRSSRRRDVEDEDGDGDRKKSRLDGENGDRKDYEDREKSSSRPDRRERERERERGDKDRHRSSRDVDKENERDRDRGGRDRDRDRGGDRDREKDKEKDRGRDREREREREKVREKEKEREIEKERERERSRRSSSHSRRHRSDRDAEPELLRPRSKSRDVDAEVLRARSRDREAKEREREMERESRRFKDKKETTEPEADPERDQRTVFAYQMPLKATERDVYEFFTKAGKVRDVRLIMDRNSRRSKGVGYVEFYDAMSVPMAIALSGHHLLGQPVMVKPSEAEKNLVQSTVAGGGAGVLSGPYGAVARKLYVGNLHFNMTEEQLRQVFEPFGQVELVQLPLDIESGLCKGFGFVQFAQLEHAKAAQSLNGKLEIAGRVIKVSAVTDHLGVQTTGANAADFDDDDGGGLSLNAQSRAMLMQKLDRSGVANTIAGSLGVLNGSTTAPSQLPPPMMGIPSAVPVPPPVYQVPEPVGNPSVCLLLKNMFDPATETEPDFDLDIKDEVEEECSKYGPVKHIFVDKHSTGYVYLRFDTVAASAACQHAMHLRWFAGRAITAVYMQPYEYEAKFGPLA